MVAYLLYAGAALYLGLLTSISPCPLATNIAAISYVGRKVGDPRWVMAAGLLYTLGRCIAYLALAVLLTTTAMAGDWKPHEVRQFNGTARGVRLPAKLQIVTDKWNRVVAVPFLVYMPAKDRLLMPVMCYSPHHSELLSSAARGATW